MKLEQHIYTSGKREFTTVAVTAGITREEQLKLESHSIYFLPVSLHYQDNIMTPVKYVFYPLNEQRFVVGRAVYKGKDSLGRTGNYLFHNVIISRADLMQCSRFNPCGLIACLEDKQLFSNHVPEKPITVIDLAPEEISPKMASSHVKTISPQQIQRDLLASILYVCLHYEMVHQPLLLIGTEQTCLEFLGWFYTILPYYLRETLCVDTYSYSVSLGFQIIGSLEDKEFQEGLTSALKLNLANLQATTNFDMPQPSKYLTFITDMAVAERIEELNAVYSVEYALRKEDFPRFKQEYPVLSQELQHVVWEFYKDAMLKRIVTDLDTELLLLIQGELKVEDLNVLYLAPEMMNQLVKTETDSNLKLIANWLCTAGEKPLFYPYLFKSLPLWRVFLARVQAFPQDVVFLLEPVKAFQGGYTREFEDILLKEMMTLLPHIKVRRTLAKALFEAFDALPVPNDEQPAQSNDPLLLLRNFIKYELSNDSDLLEQLIASKLPILTEEQQAMVFDAILDKVLIIRSFKIWNPSKIEQQVRTLLQNASASNQSLIAALTSIAKLHLVHEAKKVLKPVCSELLEHLPQHESAERIRSLVGRILKPPASLFDRIIGDFFQVKD